MSFSAKLADGFGKPLEKTPYTAGDPIVKLQFIPKGNNIVFGRQLEGDDYSNLMYLGKIFENTPNKTYFGSDAWLDVTFPHVIYITGTRGSGKSFDLGVLLEGISELQLPSKIQNDVTPITSILIDTQSQFWTLKYAPNPVIPQNANQISELNRWNIQPNSLKNCRIFIPANASPIIGDETIFRIRPRDVTQQDWCLLLGQPIYGPQGHILGEILRNLANTDFSIQNMIDFITDTTNFTTLPDASRNAIAYRLIEYGRSGLFNRDGLDVADLLKPNTCNVFMLRELRNEDKSLITALIARRLFTIMGEFHSRKRVSEFFERSYDGHVLPNKVWLLIDEGHVIAPAAIESPAREALVEYVKRGRDAGLSLVLATQQPSAIHDGILSQVNLSFNHRLTFQNDINAAINRIPTKTLSSLKLSGTNISDFGDMLRLLEAGQCFLGDHSTSRTVMVQVRPRVTSHGGYSPK